MALDLDLGWLALGLVQGLGARQAVKLLGAFGTPEGIFAASLTELEALGLPAATAQAIHLRESLRQAEEELRLVRAMDCRVVTWNDPCYPALLREIYDPPSHIYSSRGFLAAWSSWHCHCGHATSHALWESNVRKAGPRSG
jgi:predicted Rossmann fold nucleotide-binding protein DprA/Smf involved in DNA uptake